MLMLHAAEAPAVEIRRTCAAVGEIASDHQSAKVGSGADGNACRDVHRFFNRNGLTRRIPISTWESKEYEDFALPYIRIKDYLVYLLQRRSADLLGGATVNSPEGKLTLQAFWYCYRFIHPDHIVFHTPGIDLGLCIPVLIHGDSGRTLKKSPFEVVSWQVAFGSKRKHCDGGDGPARKKKRELTLACWTGLP